MKKRLIAMIIMILLVGVVFTETVYYKKHADVPPPVDAVQTDSPGKTEKPADVEKDPETSPKPTQPVQETRSLLDFLRIAKEPVGSTMYVWGGGWNEEDTGAGIEAVTLGLSSRWAEFAAEQDETYDYKQTRYQIHDGLDCSGYIGWAVYNVLETENGQDGYVLSSTKMAEHYAQIGLGEYIPAEEMYTWVAGDIMSMKGHAWIVVGTCDDGSVLLMHASPPGIVFSGTKLADGTKSQAVALAEQIMETHYLQWYQKYPNCAKSHSYLIDSSAMRWSSEVLHDEEGLRGMTAEEVVNVLFPEV